MKRLFATVAIIVIVAVAAFSSYHIYTLVVSPEPQPSRVNPFWIGG